MFSVPQSSLLSQASPEVEAADHILETIYPLSRDPKTLLSALEHELRALEHVANAAPDAMSLPGAQDALHAHARIDRALALHASSPTVFTRGGSRIVADRGFSELLIIDPRTVSQDLQAIKRFVHEARKRAALGK